MVIQVFQIHSGSKSKEQRKALEEEFDFEFKQPKDISASTRRKPLGKKACERTVVSRIAAWPVSFIISMDWWFLRCDDRV